jgi:hypothetical protein
MPATCATLIEQIASAPAALSAAVKGLNDTQLDTPYREGGWTPRQIVHHVADSHMNAYIRFKLGVTEDNPTVKPYDEKTWAETVDSRTAPVQVSLPVIEGVHTPLGAVPAIARWRLAIAHDHAPRARTDGAHGSAASSTLGTAGTTPRTLRG